MERKTLNTVMYLYFQILDLYLGREEVEVRAQRDKYSFASDIFWIHFIFITQL